MSALPVGNGVTGYGVTAYPKRPGCFTTKRPALAKLGRAKFAQAEGLPLPSLDGLSRLVFLFAEVLLFRSPRSVKGPYGASYPGDNSTAALQAVPLVNQETTADHDHKKQEKGQALSNRRADHVVRYHAAFLLPPMAALFFKLRDYPVGAAGNDLVKPPQNVWVRQRASIRHLLDKDLAPTVHAGNWPYRGDGWSDDLRSYARVCGVLLRLLQVMRKGHRQSCAPFRDRLCNRALLLSSELTTLLAIHFGLFFSIAFSRS